MSPAGRYGLVLAASVVLGLGAGSAGAAGGAGHAGAPEPPAFVGPTRILLADADSVYLERVREWWSSGVRRQEKLLLHDLRLRYWRDRLPNDMRVVFDTLGYPTGRVLLQPRGHAEEWWYYGQLDPPLRFRDGLLLDRERFEHYLSLR